MKVYLNVRVDVNPVEEEVHLDPNDVAEAVAEAIANAIWEGRDRGYDHDLAGQISVLPDYVEIAETDED